MEKTINRIKRVSKIPSMNPSTGSRTLFKIWTRDFIRGISITSRLKPEATFGRIFDADLQDLICVNPESDSVSLAFRESCKRPMQNYKNYRTWQTISDQR